MPKKRNSEIDKFLFQKFQELVGGKSADDGMAFFMAMPYKERKEWRNAVSWEGVEQFHVPYQIISKYFRHAIVNYQNPLDDPNKQWLSIAEAERYSYQMGVPMRMPSIYIAVRRKRVDARKVVKTGGVDIRWEIDRISFLRYLQTRRTERAFIESPIPEGYITIQQAYEKFAKAGCKMMNPERFFSWVTTNVGTRIKHNRRICLLEQGVNELIEKQLKAEHLLGVERAIVEVTKIADEAKAKLE